MRDQSQVKRSAPQEERDGFSEEEPVVNRPRSDEEVLQRAAEPIEKEGHRPDRGSQEAETTRREKSTRGRAS
jgi:hypothetical protein